MVCLISSLFLSSFNKWMISNPIGLVENESPVVGLKINPDSLMAMFFFRNLMKRNGNWYLRKIKVGTKKTSTISGSGYWKKVAKEHQFTSGNCFAKPR